MTDYFLIDNPNRHARDHGSHGQFHGYPSRSSQIRAIVIHTNEITPDVDGEDDTAERLAKWASTTSSTVSWHAQVDSDSTVLLLPPEFTAFQCRGYNSKTLGIELATRAHLWGDNPERDTALLERAADVVRGWCHRFDIPIVKVSKSTIDGGGRGIVAHADMDPSRRSDPGKNFPWDRFLALVRAEATHESEATPAAAKPAPKAAPAATDDEDDLMAALPTVKRNDKGTDVKRVQGLLVANGVAPANTIKPNGSLDGIFGPGTEDAVERFQRVKKLKVDGVVGRNTWTALLGA